MFKKVMWFHSVQLSSKNEIPSLDYDIYISTGGPGDPLNDEGLWEKNYLELADKIFDNKMLKKLKPCLLYNDSRIISDYQQTWRYQRVLTEHAGIERKKGNPVPDSLILVQHQSLYTLGRGATVNNLKFSPNDSGKRI